MREVAVLSALAALLRNARENRGSIQDRQLHEVAALSVLADPEDQWRDVILWASEPLG